VQTATIIGCSNFERHCDALYTQFATLKTTVQSAAVGDNTASRQLELDVLSAATVYSLRVEFLNLYMHFTFFSACDANKDAITFWLLSITANAQGAVVFS